MYWEGNEGESEGTCTEEGERRDICIRCVSGYVARQEAQQDSFPGLGAGEGGNGCRQKPGQKNPRN